MTGDDRRAGLGGRVAKVVLRAVAVIAAVIACLAVLRAVRYDTYEVVGSNMEPTMMRGDDHLVRTDGEADRGDVVVAETPDGMLVLARVVAVGGDLLDFVDGGLMLNGAPLDEPYLPEGTHTTSPTNGALTVTVPLGTVFLLGDNRDESLDSRHYGPVDADKVTGAVTDVPWWPF